MSGIDIGPKISIDGEKEFRDAIKAINSQIKASTSEIKALSAEYDKNNGAVENLTKRQRTLKDGISAAQNKVKALTSEYGRQNSKLEQLGDQLREAKKKFGSTSDEALKAENAYSRQAQAVNDLEGKISTARGQIASMNSQLEENSRQLEEARSRAVKCGDALERAGGKITKIGDGISKAGGAMSLVLTAPLVTAGTAAFKLASDAETTFAKVGTIADSSVRSLDEIRSSVMQASSETGEAVTDFNEALYQTISATGDTQNAVNYTITAVKAAKGGFTDTATAVNGLTTIMNSYGMKGAAAMEKVSDQMLIAQNYGKTTFGELASSMGQVVPIAAQLDMGTDTLLATMAALTKNGIGTSQAVTGLKAALSNIIKPSTEASKAAGALGLDFSAAALQSKGLVGFMQDVKAALAEASPQYAKLSDNLDALYEEMAGMEAAGQKGTQQYKNLQKAAKSTEEEMKTLAGAADSSIAGFSTLFGSVEGLNSMLVLASETGGKDLEGALKAMQDSAGATQEAFDKMNSTPAAQMQIELNKLKNTGIETGAKLLPVITKVVHLAGDVLDQYNALDDATKNTIIRTAGLAAAAGPVLKIGGTAISGVGKLTSGVGGLAKGLGKLKATERAADVVGNLGVKAIESTDEVSKFSKVLSGLGTAGKIVGGVVAGAALIGGAVKFIRDSMIKADIASQFGKISLSAEEVEDVATRITTTDWIVKINAAVAAKEDIQQAEADIKSAVEELNKLNWKVQVGLELTEAEEDSYKSSTDSYIKGAQDYVDSSGYAVELAIDATFDPDDPTGKGLSSFASEFYSSAAEKLKRLGESLADAVNGAFEYNLLGDNIEIDRLMEKINDITAEFQEAEHQARLGRLKVELSTENPTLDSDSFHQVVESANEMLQEEIDTALETLELDLQPVELRYGAMLEEGFSEDLAQSLKDLGSSAAIQKCYSNIAETSNAVLETIFGMVPQNYRDQLEKSKEDINQYTKEFIQDVVDDLEETGTMAHVSFANFQLDIPQQLTKDAKCTITDMLDGLAPTKESLENLANQCIEDGRVVPQSVKDGLSDIAQWEAAAGKASGMYTLFAEKLANDPKKREALFAQAEFGRNIPEELARAITLHTGYAYDAATGMWEKVSEANQLSAEEVAAELNKNGADHATKYADGIAEQYGLIYENGKWVVDKAAQGVRDNNGALNSAILANLKGAQAVADENPIQATVDADTSTATKKINQLVSRPWTIFTKVEPYTGLNSGLTPIPHAHGGIIDHPVVAMAGEDGPEAIIPLSPKYHEDAMALLDETARRVNAEAFDHMISASYAIGAQRRAQAAPAGAQTTYRLEKGAVQIEINTTGDNPEAIAEAIEEQIYRQVERRWAAYGG